MDTPWKLLVTPEKDREYLALLSYLAADSLQQDSAVHALLDANQ